MNMGTLGYPHALAGVDGGERAAKGVFWLNFTGRSLSAMIGTVCIEFLKTLQRGSDLEPRKKGLCSKEVGTPSE
jgi:hypothetical protein